MYPLEHNVSVLGHSHRVCAVISLVSDEIKMPRTNLATGKQGIYVGGQTRHVNRFDRLVIELAVLVARISGVADEVVVCREMHGLRAVHAQLSAKALGGGGLARRAGTRKEYQPYPWTGDYIVGYAGKRLALPGLADANELVHAPARGQSVQIVYAHAPHCRSRVTARRSRVRHRRPCALYRRNRTPAPWHPSRFATSRGRCVSSGALSWPDESAQAQTFRRDCR